MGRPLSVDLRERLIAAFEEGLSRRAVARRFAVSESCAIKLVRHWQRTGSVRPKTPGARKPYALAAHERLVRALVAAEPDMTLDEMHERLATGGVAVGRTSIHRYLKALGLTLKKSRSAPRSKPGRTSRRPGKPGARAKPSSSRRASSSSTRPG